MDRGRHRPGCCLRLHRLLPIRSFRILKRSLTVSPQLCGILPQEWHWYRRSSDRWCSSMSRSSCSRWCLLSLFQEGYGMRHTCQQRQRAAPPIEDCQTPGPSCVLSGVPTTTAQIRSGVHRQRRWILSSPVKEGRPLPSSDAS